MNRPLTLLTGAVALAVAILGIVVTDSYSADDPPIVVPKDIAEAVNKMADDAGKNNDVKKPAAEFAKKHPDDLKKIMWIYKPRMKNGEGGFGIGKPGTYEPDGIEGMILSNVNPRKKPMSEADLKKAAPDLERIADITLAMAEITEYYTPKKKVGDMDPADWTKSNAEMKKAALELKAAVKANKPEDVKKAFSSIASSCSACHTVFRP